MHGVAALAAQGGAINGAPADRGMAELAGEARHPLQGVRFAALRGPGPSGTRPEDLAEMLGVLRRRVASKATRALGLLLDVIGLVKRVLVTLPVPDHVWCC